MKKNIILTIVLLILIFSISTSYASSQKRSVFAHYMTWFARPEISNKWGCWSWPNKPHKRNPDRILHNGRRDIASLHYPLIGPYDSTDEDVLEYHILLAKAAGIDGFVVNWYNFEDKHGDPMHVNRSFKKLIQVSERLSFEACIDLDDKCMTDRNLLLPESLTLTSINH